MIELEPGQSYTVNLTVRNTSTRGGQPTAATLGVGILAMVDSIDIIPEQVSQENFAAGQTRSFDYSLTIPQDAEGTGYITGWIEDPRGSEIARATEDVVVGVAPPELSNLYGVVLDKRTEQRLPGVSVSLDGHMVGTDASGGYLFRGFAPGAYHVSFEAAGYQPLLLSIELVAGNNELTVMMEPILDLVTIDSFKILYNRQGRYIDSAITITNHTFRTFIDQSAWRGQFRVGMMATGSVSYIWLQKPWGTVNPGLGDVPPSTRTYTSRVYDEIIAGGVYRWDREGLVEGAKGYVSIVFVASDVAPTPILVLASATKSFEGIFSGVQQTWAESDWVPPPPPTFPGFAF